MAYPTDDDVKNSLVAIMQPAAVKALFLTRWTLGSIEDSDKWPGELKSPTDAGKAHGFVLIREDGDGEISGSRVEKRFWTYTMFGLMVARGGSKTDNSEIDWQNEIDAIIDRLDSNDAANVGNAMRVAAPRFRTDQRKFGGILHHTALIILRYKPCHITP